MPDEENSCICHTLGGWSNFVMDNISDILNMLSLAEAGLCKLTNILVQMRSKTNQAVNDGLSSVERQTIQSQLQAFAAKVDDIVNETKWNGVKLLDGKSFTPGWPLRQKHDAYALGIAQKKSSPGLTQISSDSSFIRGSAGIQQSSTSIGMYSIRTGTYVLEVIDRTLDPEGVTSGPSLSAGEIKLELRDSSGQAYKMLHNGDLSCGIAADALYAAESNSAHYFESGVGFKFKIDSRPDARVGDRMIFDFEEASQYFINVSTPSKAASYMSRVTSALEFVNRSMAMLVSLTAQIGIQEEMHSSTHVNIESAGNHTLDSKIVEELVKASKHLVLHQTPVAMLVQAFQAPQFISSLFQ